MLAMLPMLFATVCIVFLEIGPAASCGSSNSAKARLGIYTADRSNAQTNSPIYATVRTGGGWSGWEQMNNANCNDFKRDSWDYFDNFDEHFENGWDAMALYNCGDDALMIGQVKYWNGASSNNAISDFCQDIAGPFHNCGDGAISGTCISGVPEKKRYKIDQDSCHGIVFTTTDPAEYYTASSPGIPSCGSSAKAVPLNNDDAFEIVVDQQVAISATVLGVFLVLICFAAYCAVLRCLSRPQTGRKYESVDIDGDSELEQIKSF
jgi:hypothetical protein